jgi:cholesterol transport system auxiliary component
MLAIIGHTGCGSSQPVRPDRYYRLSPAVTETPAVAAPVPGILLVNDLAAHGFLGGRPIVFRTREATQVVQRYEDLLWEEPPTQSLANALVAAIRAARVFEFVVVPADRARADYLLGGEVERFEQLPTDQPPRVAIRFRLALVRADHRGSMASQDYGGEEPVDAATPQAMVAAFDRLSGWLIAEAVRDLKDQQPRLRAAVRP